MTTFDFPIRLEPAYTTDAPNQPVEIYSGPLVVNSELASYSGPGRLVLEWIPSPSVRWYVEDDELPHLGLGEVSLRLPPIPNDIRAQLTESSTSVGRAGKTPRAAGFVENGQGQQWAGLLRSVTFHIANFIPFLGNPVRDKDGQGASKSRAILKGAGWRITIDGIRSLSESRSYARDRGGFLISHVGQIAREDGGDFSPTDAKHLLDDLYWFFSFCRGRATPAILPLGFEASGEQVWSEWGSWNVAPNEPWRNWYNDFNVEGLEGTFPGFMTRIADPHWSDPLKLAIYWYLEAGTLGNDSALILLQAAFELLAWTWSAGGHPSDLPERAKQVRRTPAAKKLRELLAHQSIPRQIQPSLEHLRRLATIRGWLDGPQALTGLRNALVHPSPQLPNEGSTVDARAYFEAYSLSLWYLELLLLRLLGYQGTYSNRLVLSGFKGNDVELVPWATSAKREPG